MTRTVHAVGRISPTPFLGGLHHLYARVDFRQAQWFAMDDPGRRLRKPDVARVAGELAAFQRTREQRDKDRRQKEHLISCCDRRQ
jgi:hypothetical protein